MNLRFYKKNISEKLWAHTQHGHTQLYLLSGPIFHCSFQQVIFLFFLYNDKKYWDQPPCSFTFKNWIILKNTDFQAQELSTLLVSEAWEEFLMKKARKQGSSLTLWPSLLC